ncbi:HNH endonuclease family protein (plasmid) [Streptomyces sp. NBC_01558]|uniref:HNH endonuclease family protein n=1 Tax=Streptomyces sp. NBC_01558 TaxID=2975878 RepID=UPI002DD9B72F|nr:HNH endonuclease family protein [Streptomyces sp. NBC_01558]WSD82153.1 HNH endonuclease family protein [Streptomyces sp. NBC_01558]
MFSKIAALAAALLALPLTITPASAHQLPSGPLPMAAAVDLLPTAAESRDGYQRTSFKHWVDADHDGCTTRAEVLIAESRVQPTIEPGCKVTAGQWYSFYDGVTVTAPGGLDIDHMVPLAEAWDSGASAWTPERREAYANDLGADTSLVAVTARTNRSKADQDPAEWLPPLLDARCTYAADWVATKLRWKLSVDDRERKALAEIAAGCGQESVTYETAP